MSEENYTNIFYSNMSVRRFILHFNTTANKTGGQRTLPLLKTGEIIQLLIYINILVIGCSGNTLVILYFAFKTKARQQFNHYLINLAFVDLLTSIFTPMNFIYTIISNYEWHIGMAMCIGISSLGPLTVNVSAWIITSIAIERHRGIKNPLQARYSRVQVYMTMVLIWIISIVTLIPYMMSIDIENNECRPIWPNANTEFIYSLVLLVLQSILPSVMMMVMFISIYRAVTDRGKFLSAHYRPSTTSFFKYQKRRAMSTKALTLEKRDKKLFNMLSIALILFIVCSIPYNIFYTALLYLVRITNKPPKIDIWTTNIWLSMLVTVNSCFNFFIYAGMDKSFKSYCKSFILCRDYSDTAVRISHSQCSQQMSKLTLNINSDSTDRVTSSRRKSSGNPHLSISDSMRLMRKM